MCGGSSSSQTSDTTQSLQLGSASLGGSEYVLNFPNVTQVPNSFQLPQIGAQGASPLHASMGLVLLLAAGFLAYKLLE